MKLTIYALAQDTRKEGTACCLFKSKQDLHDELKSIMERDLDSSGDDSNAAREIRDLIHDKSIEEAWEFWESEYADGLNTYSIEETTFDIPTTAKVEVSGGVADVTECDPGVEVTIQDHDNEAVGE